MNLPRPMKGKAWIGAWSGKTKNEQLGWAVPNFVDNYGANGPIKEPWAHGTFYLCDVTIKLHRDKLGRIRSRIVSPFNVCRKDG